MTYCMSPSERLSRSLGFGVPVDAKCPLCFAPMKVRPRPKHPAFAYYIGPCFKCRQRIFGGGWEEMVLGHGLRDVLMPSTPRSFMVAEGVDESVIEYKDDDGEIRTARIPTWLLASLRASQKPEEENLLDTVRGRLAVAVGALIHIRSAAPSNGDGMRLLAEMALEKIDP